jgi:hypothetical protein
MNWINPITAITQLICIDKKAINGDGIIGYRVFPFSYQLRI